MISNEAYNHLVNRSRQPKSIVEFFRESPLVGVELNSERDKDEGRDVLERTDARRDLGRLGGTSSGQKTDPSGDLARRGVARSLRG